MIKKFKIFFIPILLIFIIEKSYSSDCAFDKRLKVGIIENDFIDYYYYLYYVVGEFSYKNSINFEIDVVNKDIDKYDIIFGEYYDLKKLTRNEISYPDKIKNFYEKNGIEIYDNIFPLDLDTFILLSKEQNVPPNFEELSKLISDKKYTLGVSLEPKENFLKYFSYIIEKDNFNLKEISIEANMSLFKNTMKNFNKNLLFSDYLEVYQSYEDSENLFTLFNDGILLYKNINYKNFELFPKSKYKWVNSEGIFKKTDLFLPYSYYGFSAYINNINQIGLLCYMVEENVRLNSFNNFNLGLSPLSLDEISPIEATITQEYKKILEMKNQSIIDLNFNYAFYETFMNYMLENKTFTDILKEESYLNIN